MKSFRKAVLTAAAAGALSLALAANAQAQAPHIPASAYRAGEPDVITRAPEPLQATDARPFHRAAFTAAYARAKRPAVAVLWNREYSDMLEQNTLSQARVDSVQARYGETIGLAAQRRGLGVAYGEAAGAAVASTTVSVGESKTSQARRTGPVERTDLQMRAAFQQTMASAGVRLVDRNVVMRSLAASKKTRGQEIDSQQIEAEAIASHAQVLIEVLTTRDAAAPLGWSVFVSIKRMADGVILAEGYLDGEQPKDAPAPRVKFEADPNGGYREAPQSNAATDVGRRMGEQTLARLGEALAR
ncbi:hypothetical protein [Ottowia thiooxydans]|uniref:hypothetical protein n=1 Tax=Ottowia thiooxydans TaxID=219182 RepID=UPI00041E8FF6|nr:hypothetical protein [Ottowia thiooxydans]